MPGFDGTGPSGQGPLTGGGRGYCVKPLGSEKRLYTGYPGSQVYPVNPDSPYSSNYIRYGFDSYNYPGHAGNRISILPLARPNGISGYGRFPRIGQGRGMGRRGRRF